MKDSKKTLSIKALMLILVLPILLLNARPVFASEIGTSRRFGIGGMLGAPTGLSMKYYLSPLHALDFGVGFGYWGRANLYLHVDYKFHIMLTQNADFDLPLYIGVGGKMGFWFDDEYERSYWGGDERSGYWGFGIRVPIGVAFNLNSVPLDIFGEIVPGIGLFPGVGAFLDGAIGVRYYF